MSSRPPQRAPTVHHLALRAEALARTASFYQDVLGFAVVREQPGYSVWLGLDERAVLMIEQRAEAEAGGAPGSMDLLAFAVTPEQRDAVRSKVSVEHETAATTYFRDPDGRRVAVSTFDLSPWTGRGD